MVEFSGRVRELMAAGPQMELAWTRCPVCCGKRRLSLTGNVCEVCGGKGWVGELVHKPFNQGIEGTNG